MINKKNKILNLKGKSKRFTAVTLAAVIMLACAFSGCNSNDAAASKEPSKATSDTPDKINIVTTIFPQYDFARQIAGDNADITMLLGPGEESHTFEPTPQDIIDIQNADIFIYVGGESESWVDGILDSFDTSGMEIISMMDIVDVVEEEVVEGMENHEDENEQDEENEDDGGEDSDVETPDSSEEKEYDEHVWTSIDNAQIITQAIADSLCEIDEPNRAVYTSNCEVYLAQLSNLKKEFSRIVKGAQRDTIVFGDRFPLRYFADEFGLEYYAAFPGCAEQSEPSAGTVAFLIEKVREENIPVVFYLELSNGKVAKTIAESSDAETMQFNSCHNVTMEQFLDGVTYVDLMTENVEALRTALM